MNKAIWLIIIAGSLFFIYGCKKDCSLNSNIFYEDEDCKNECIDKYSINEYLTGETTESHIKMMPANQANTFNLDIDFSEDNFTILDYTAICTLTSCNGFICEDYSISENWISHIVYGTVINSKINLRATFSDTDGNNEFTVSFTQL